MTRTHASATLIVAVLSLPFSFARAWSVQAAQTLPQRPTPRTAFTGPVLELDWPAVRIGIAEYDEGPTGATVFYFPNRVMAVVDARGGAPGTIMTDILRLGYDSRWINAIVFAGGSSQGLAAATGAADAIREASGDSASFPTIATVAGAIIFDLGGRRLTTVTPDDALGRAALHAAVESRFPLGARGAGRFALQGGYDGAAVHSGQGAAYRHLGATRIAVFTVVNALGTIVDREGRIVRCRRAATADGCGRIADRLAEIHSAVARRAETPSGGGDAAAEDAEPDVAGTRNTTITLVATNRKLRVWELQRIAVQVHTSMARAIQPFHTQGDGDVLYAVSTNEVEDSTTSLLNLGAIASEVAWDAILASVPVDSSPAPVRTIALDEAAAAAVVGTYQFARGLTVEVSRGTSGLVARSSRGVGMYLPRGRALDLTPVGADMFLVAGAQRDYLQFIRGTRGRITGLVINPGLWSIAGTRAEP